VKVFTVHTRPGRAPVLLQEGFSWGGLIFGPVWLLAHRAWIPGVLALCVWVVAAVGLPHHAAGPAVVAMHWALGLFGQDLRRWSLARAGYCLVHIVAAADDDMALARLLDRRPDLIPSALGVEVPA